MQTVSRCVDLRRLPASAVLQSFTGLTGDAARPAKAALRALTLVELMVVIGIISVLTVLGLAAVQKMREHGESARCIANLRNIGAALFGFAGDHEGYFPQAGGIINEGEVNPETGLPGWTEQIADYLGQDRSVFRCASSARVIPENQHFSYFLGARAAFEEVTENLSESVALKQQRIHAASQYVLGGDIVGRMFTLKDADKDDFVFNPAFERPSMIHGGTVNILFADGSVRAVREFDPDRMEISYSGPGVVY